MRSVLMWLLLFQFIGLFAQDEKKGRLQGQFRNYYLATWNQKELRDFSAFASGVKISYLYQFSLYFKMNGALYSTFNWGIQDLSVRDAFTGRISRYELGLFDVNNPSDRFLAFPGELNAQFSLKGHSILIGRMKYVSPLLNPQDGRMIPTLIQGVNYDYESNLFSLGLGVFNGIAPRSTDGFVSIEKSIGLYPEGRLKNGRPGQYRGQVESDFLIIANGKLVQGSWKGEVWNYLIENVSNSIYMKHTVDLTDHRWKFELEGVRQDKLGDGGNSVDSLTYFGDRSSFLYGLRVTKRIRSHELSLSYNHILNGGRFLFPREWGREGLFSFQKRERTEGMANNHSLVIYHRKKYEFGLQSIVSLGHHWRENVSNFEQNKYALPSYYHLNIDIFYFFQKHPGLRPEILLTYKLPSKDNVENPNLKLNKVNMYQVNAILNYNF